MPFAIIVKTELVFQVVNSLGALGGDEAAGGIAYAAHIGGFIAGLILVKRFVKKRMVLENKRKAFWQNVNIKIVRLKIFTVHMSMQLR